MLRLNVLLKEDRLEKPAWMETSVTGNFGMRSICSAARILFSVKYS